MSADKRADAVGRLLHLAHIHSLLVTALDVSDDVRSNRIHDHVMGALKSSREVNSRTANDPERGTLPRCP